MTNPLARYEALTDAVAIIRAAKAQALDLPYAWERLQHAADYLVTQQRDEFMDVVRSEMAAGCI